MKTLDFWTYKSFKVHAAFLTSQPQVLMHVEEPTGSSLQFVYRLDRSHKILCHSAEFGSTETISVERLVKILIAQLLVRPEFKSFILRVVALWPKRQARQLAALEKQVAQLKATTAMLDILRVNWPTSRLERVLARLKEVKLVRNLGGNKCIS